MRILDSLSTCMLVLTSVMAGNILPAQAQVADQKRVAIIDTAFDTSRHLNTLKTAGVKVIGRYYARCPQSNLRQKRLILDENGNARKELKAILDAGFAVMSIYQYHSNHEIKYIGKRFKKVDNQKVRGPDGNFIEFFNPLDDCKTIASANRTPEEIANLDADAALYQAELASQPKGSAVYFGIDYNFKIDDAEVRGNLLKYFRQLQKRFEASDLKLKLGAYGNGDALALLHDEGIVEFTWIMASNSFEGSSKFHSSGRWDLYQNQVDKTFFSKSGSLPIDPNVQRPGSGYIGFWHQGADGINKPFFLSEQQNRAIIADRKFVCNGDAWLRSQPTLDKPDKIGVIRYASSVTIGAARKIRGQSLVEVDTGADGKFDGWTALSNLTPDYSQKPKWFYAGEGQKGLKCEAKLFNF